jgi:3-oxoadipate enol-lactonase
MSLLFLTPIGLDAGCRRLVGVRDATTPPYPGHGGTPVASRPYSLADIADVVAEGLTRPVDVVGISMGGMVAQHLALRHPERVRSLLLACTTASADRRAARERARVAETDGMRALTESTLRRWFSAEALGASPDHPGVDYARRTLLALSPAAFADAWRAVACHNVLDALCDIPAPVTCLAADADESCTPSTMKTLHTRLRHSRFALVQGTHMLPLERPQVFANALQDHLAWASTHHRGSPATGLG